MDLTTEHLAAFTDSLSYAALSPEAIHSAKRCIIDSIGCALGAFHGEPVRALRALAAEISSASPSTLIGTRIQSSAEMAAFVNGAMIHYLDFNDNYFGPNLQQPGPHPSDNIGSILAITESMRGDGSAFILGTVVAYEVCAQLTDHVTIGRNGWDYPILHSAATALGAGKVMGLTQEQLRHALSLALVPNICLRETRKGELSVWKGLAGPNGSRAGLFAAQLAKAGITGPAEPFEGKAGFMKQLDTHFKLGNIGGSGTPYKIESISLKYFPIVHNVQLAVSTALELHKKIKVEDIQSIVVYVDDKVAHNDTFSAQRLEPKNRETADHSGPYLIGAALVDGKITEDTMTPKRYRDPTVLSLIRKIRVEEDKAYTAARPALNCRLEATLKSGEIVTVHQSNPKGYPANPLTDNEIEEKFLSQVSDLLPDTKSRTLLNDLWNLDKSTDLGKLFDSMVLTPGSSSPAWVSAR